MTTASPRIIVVDENLNKRLATELAYRGRDATSVSALGLGGSTDPQLLVKLDAQLDDWVLVTADDALPADHRRTNRRCRRNSGPHRPGPDANLAA